MKEDYDSSRNPELIYHYVSHALILARLGGEQDPQKRIKAKGNLIKKLNNLYEEDSLYFILSKEILKYLDKSDKWDTPKKVDEFQEEFERLYSKLIGKNK